MVRTSCSLLVAGKDTSFNVLVSRVGIKLDEGHLPLKFAVFPVKETQYQELLSLHIK